MHAIDTVRTSRLARGFAPPWVLAAVVLLSACQPEPAGVPGSSTARRTPPPVKTRAKGGVVARLPSKFGTLLVFDDGPWRCMAFNKKSAVQSCRHRKHHLDFRYEYVPMMFAAALAHAAPRRIALLGLGGAALPNLLRTHRPDVSVDSVEIDPAVVTAAKRWFGYRPRATERIYTEDAARFVGRAELQGQYDVVLVDCYGEHFIPPHLQKTAFLRAVRGLLRPGGVVVANIWETHPKYKEMVWQYSRLFPHIWILPGKKSGNTMLVAARKLPFPNLGALRTRARRFESRIRPPLPISFHLKRLKSYP